MLRLHLFTLAVLAALPTAAAEHLHWGYGGDHGPDTWSTLSPDYELCGTGRNQSPIDVTPTLDADLPPLRLESAGLARRIAQPGHAVQLDFEPGSGLQLDGRRFALLQAHFHAPSEHRLRGRQFPLEAHLVHADEQGQLAVLSVLFETGAHNSLLDGVFAALPLRAGQSAALEPGLPPARLLPDRLDYIRFSGSLTTPPCSEGVRWLLLRQPNQVSPEQLLRLTGSLDGPNNRPIQPLNARLVVE